MEARDVTTQRLLNQHVTRPRLRTALQVVSELGAIQSQDFGMAKWAIGVRLMGATERTVEAVIEDGDIVRMHLLRPTWHFAARQDARWMLDLTGPNIRASMKYRDRQLGLTQQAVGKSNRIIEKALKAGPATRDALVAALEAGGFPNEDNRAAHLLMRAELDRVACSAPPVEGKQAYVLFDAWIPPARPLTRDESLGALARRYFGTRCPATVRDFCWWSGLALKDARDALEMVCPDFMVEKAGSHTWVFDASSRRLKVSSTDGKSTGLLPAFDEMILSYADRSALFDGKDGLQGVVSGGIIRPIIISGGRVVGTWNRRIEGEKVVVTLTSRGKLARAAKASMEEAARRYAAFLRKPHEILMTSA